MWRSGPRSAGARGRTCWWWTATRSRTWLQASVPEVPNRHAAFTVPALPLAGTVSFGVSVYHVLFANRARETPLRLPQVNDVFRTPHARASSLIRNPNSRAIYVSRTKSRDSMFTYMYVSVKVEAGSARPGVYNAHGEMAMVGGCCGGQDHGALHSVPWTTKARAVRIDPPTAGPHYGPARPPCARLIHDGPAPRQSPCTARPPGGFTRR